MLVMKATPSLKAREERPVILVFFGDERREIKEEQKKERRLIEESALNAFRVCCHWPWSGN